MITTPRPGDILAALQELGALDDARVTAGEAYVLCPYHADRRTGSFSVNLETGLNKCFSCGQGGSFARYLGAAHGMTAVQARRWCITRLLPARRDDDAAPLQPQVTEASLALFTAPPPEALAARRVSAEACRALGIRWDPRAGSWIFPVRGPHDGHLQGWQAKHGSTVRNYPRGVPVKSALFGSALLPASPRIVLVESPLDAAVMLDAGYPAVSSYGAGCSDIQLGLIAEHCTSLVVAYDSDRAGEEAAARIWAGWRKLPVRMFSYQDTDAKDPGDMTADQIRRGMSRLLC